MIPLTLDSMFKAVFTFDLDILKEFIILETNLDLDLNNTNIIILNNELSKSKFKEYKKTIDILIVLDNRITVNIELNNTIYNEYLAIRNELYASKLFISLYEKGFKKNDFQEKEIIQLNLNTKNFTIGYGEDIIIPYGKNTGKFYKHNKQTILKYLAYYRNLYYNSNVKLTKGNYG